MEIRAELIRLFCPTKGDIDERDFGIDKIGESIGDGATNVEQSPAEWTPPIGLCEDHSTWAPSS